MSTCHHVPSVDQRRSAGKGESFKSAHLGILVVQTEAEGFEPPVPYGTAIFKTAALSHSATPPIIERAVNVTLLSLEVTPWTQLDRRRSDQ